MVVQEDQLSLAIGRDGQNARLAAKLTGWRIDIKSESKMREVAQWFAEAVSVVEGCGDPEAEWLLQKFQELKVNRETIQPLILGRDLIALGVPPGPGMGRLLKKLYQMQLDNAYETRDTGLEEARRMLEEEKA